MSFTFPITIDYTSQLGTMTAGFSHDNTSALQTAINNAATNGHMLYIDEKYGVLPNTSGTGVLSIPSNSWIRFGPGAGLKNLAHNVDFYHMLKLDGVTNVTIEDAWLDGSAELNSANPSNQTDWGMGIGIYGGSGHFISRPHIMNTWGDGLYFDSNSDSVTVTDAIIERARRNGISVIGASNLLIVRPTIIEAGQPNSLNTRGVNPGAGIDIEPDNATNSLVNLRIISPRIIKAKSYGLCIDLGSLNNTSPAPSMILSDVQDIDTLGFSGISWSNCTNVTTGGFIHINNPKYIHDGGQATPVNWDTSVPVTVTSATSIG